MSSPELCFFFSYSFPQIIFHSLSSPFILIRERKKGGKKSKRGKYVLLETSFQATATSRTASPSPFSPGVCWDSRHAAIKCYAIYFLEFSGAQKHRISMFCLVWKKVERRRIWVAVWGTRAESLIMFTSGKWTKDGCTKRIGILPAELTEVQTRHSESIHPPALSLPSYLFPKPNLICRTDLSPPLFSFHSHKIDWGRRRISRRRGWRPFNSSEASFWKVIGSDREIEGR